MADLDAQGLREILEQATLAIGISATTQDLIVPLIAMVGTGWETGKISVAEEHAASAVLKEYLILNSRPFAETTGAPCLVVATPPGQLHDLGAALVTNLARRMGWNVSYLGPSLPAEEIARAAVRSEALAVALSIVYPADDPQLPVELRRLRRFIPASTSLLVGGRSAGAYHEVIKDIGATLITDLPSLSSELESLRARRLDSE